MTAAIVKLAAVAAVRIVETLGAEKALELLYCTEDLEDAGGLMTMVSAFTISISISVTDH